MKEKNKEMFSKIILCVLAFFIPLLLLGYCFQIRRYAELSREISELEIKQERLVEQNKKLVSDISLLSSTDRIEKMAEDELGMHKLKQKILYALKFQERKNE